MKTHKGMRIIAGAWRGRALLAPDPDDNSIRPTADRTRTAIFNILYSAHALPAGAHVLDICCGTGAMGLEALSRGATHATFIDKNPRALKLTTANLEKFDATDRAQVLYADAAALHLPLSLSLPPASSPYHLVFLDPPYHRPDAEDDLGAPDLLASALQGLLHGGWLADGAVVVIETAADHSPKIPPAFKSVDERRYGAAKLLFLLYET